MWLFFALPVLVLFVMGVIHASESLDKIRLHWNEYRCNPIYLPFAGWVRPDIGVESNFQHCMNMMGQDVFKYLIDAIHSLLGDLSAGVSELTSPLSSMRGVMTMIRKGLFSFGAQTFGKIANSMASMSYILIKIRDIMKRFVGEGYIAAFLANAGIDFAVSFVMAVMTVIKMFVYALLAISIVLALFQPELLAFAVTIASLLAASGFS